jgi:ACS family tartrate transporter-like MFS transporter
MGFTDVQVGFVTAMPYVAASAAMLVWGRHSDLAGERRWHVAGPVAIGAVGLAASAWLSSPLWALLALGVATAGMFAGLGPFWSISPRFLRGPAAAGGLALTNSIGALGGFVGPYLVGWIKESTGSFSAGLGALAVGVAVAAGLVLLLPRESQQER